MFSFLKRAYRQSTEEFIKATEQDVNNITQKTEAEVVTHGCLFVRTVGWDGKGWKDFDFPSLKNFWKSFVH